MQHDDSAQSQIPDGSSRSGNNAANERTSGHLTSALPSPSTSRMLPHPIASLDPLPPSSVPQFNAAHDASHDAENSSSGGKLIPSADDQSVPILPHILKPRDSMVSTSTQDSFDLAKARMSRTRRRIPIAPATRKLPVSRAFQEGMSSRSQRIVEGLAGSMHSAGTQDSMVIHTSRMLRTPIILCPLPDVDDTLITGQLLSKASSVVPIVTQGLGESKYSSAHQNAAMSTQFSASMRARRDPNNSSIPKPPYPVKSSPSRTNSIYSAGTQDSIVLARQRRNPNRLLPPMASREQRMNADLGGAGSTQLLSRLQSLTSSMTSVVAQDSITISKSTMPTPAKILQLVLDADEHPPTPVKSNQSRFVPRERFAWQDANKDASDASSLSETYDVAPPPYSQSQPALVVPSSEGRGSNSSSSLSVPRGLMKSSARAESVVMKEERSSSGRRDKTRSLSDASASRSQSPSTHSNEDRVSRSSRSSKSSHMSRGKPNSLVTMESVVVTKERSVSGRKDKSRTMSVTSPSRSPSPSVALGPPTEYRVAKSSRSRSMSRDLTSSSATSESVVVTKERSGPGRRHKSRSTSISRSKSPVIESGPPNEGSVSNPTRSDFVPRDSSIPSVLPESAVANKVRSGAGRKGKSRSPSAKGFSRSRSTSDAVGLSNDSAAYKSSRSGSMPRTMPNSSAKTEPAVINMRCRSVERVTSRSTSSQTIKKHDKTEIVTDRPSFSESVQSTTPLLRPARMMRRRSMPRSLSALGNSGDSVEDDPGLPRLHSQRRIKKAKKSTKPRSLSPSLGTKDNGYGSLDDDSLAEVKAFFRDIKFAQHNSSNVLIPERKKSPPGECDPRVRALSPKLSRKDPRSKSTSEAKDAITDTFMSSSDESILIALDVQLNQPSALDFSRQRTVTPLPSSAANSSKGKDGSRSPRRMRSGNTTPSGETSMSPRRMRTDSMNSGRQDSMRWEEIARQSHVPPAKPFDNAMQEGQRSPFREYVTTLAPDLSEDKEETRSLYLQIMNESDPRMADAMSMDSIELFNLLNDSSQLDESDLPSNSDDEGANAREIVAPPGKRLSAKEVLAYLETDNRNDMPQQCSAARDRGMVGKLPVLTPAEMADILNHVSTHHGNNDEIRWDVIARMAREVGNEDFNARLPFEYVGGDATDEDSSVSSISEDGVDESTGFLSSGGSLRWDPGEFFY